MAPDWSSLPVDLVNRVAGCLLATNDLDCYTDLRGVCRHWRSVTADPRSNQHDPRFRPSRWVMLDERKSASCAVNVDSALLFVNTTTGRFVRRSLAFLRDCDRNCDYVFITSTVGGLLVLAARQPPHAVSVVNPFTGSVICFAAQLPTEPAALTAYVVGSTPTLVLVSISSKEVYWTDPQSASFTVETHGICPASRLSQIAAGVNHEAVPGASRGIFDELLSDTGERCRCYAVELPEGDLLAVLKRRRGMDVFKIDAAGIVMERVKSIGNLALFLGVRCLAVDTDCFPMVEANCAYFLLTGLFLHQRYIYKLNIGCYGAEPELILEYVDNLRPYSLAQLFCIYTMDVPGHLLTSERRSNYREFEGYVGYVDDEPEEDYWDYY